MTTDFVPFPKIPRLVREIVITEKLDGTNAQVIVAEDGTVSAASRNRFITPDDDNYGFATWVAENAESLRDLGPGHHFGEWWGRGIQRNYGLEERRFSLFNVHRWVDERPVCCGVVPVLYHGVMNTLAINVVIEKLRDKGSVAAPGFMQPEGVIVYHTAANQMFKQLIENDASPKSR